MTQVVKEVTIMSGKIEPKGKQLEDFWRALTPAIKRLVERQNTEKD